MIVSLIAAVAENGVIGRDGDLPWHLPADLKRFKQLTLGHHLIVGRRTWESVGRPLPGREFIVVTSRRDLRESGLLVAGSVEEAIAMADEAGDDEPFVAGGAGIYREALERDLVDRVYLTRIHSTFAGDTRFPPFREEDWSAISLEEHPANPSKGLPSFSFVVLGRRTASSGG